MSDIAAQASRINLRHVAIAIVLGYAAKAGLEVRPDILYDTSGKNKFSPNATPTTIGWGVALVSLWAMYTNRLEGASGASGVQTFYSVETMPGALGGQL